MFVKFAMFLYPPENLIQNVQDHLRGYNSLSRKFFRASEETVSPEATFDTTSNRSSCQLHATFGLHIASVQHRGLNQFSKGYQKSNDKKKRKSNLFDPHQSFLRTCRNIRHTRLRSISCSSAFLLA